MNIYRNNFLIIQFLTFSWSLIFSLLFESEDVRGSSYHELDFVQATGLFKWQGILVNSKITRMNSVLHTINPQKMNFSFVLFKGRSLKMNEKITAAWINIFLILFRRFGCLCSHFQEIHSTSERKGRILTPTNRNTSTTKRCYTEGERNRGRENDEESNRGTSSSMDADREGENKYV